MNDCTCPLGLGPHFGTCPAHPYNVRKVKEAEAMKPMHELLDEIDGRFCLYCEEQIIDTPVDVRGIFDRHEGWAHERCHADAGEMADEDRRAEFYGGSSPQTDRERYDEAAEEKKKYG